MIYTIYISVFLTLFLLIVGIFSKKEELDIASRLELKKEEKKEKFSVGRVILGGIVRQISKIKHPAVVQYRKELRKKLNQAGNPRDLTPDGFIALILVSIFGIFILELLFLKTVNILTIAIAIFGGYFMPNASLNNLIAKRHRAILRELPNVLDLLTLSMEAGIDFNAAVNKVIAKSQKTPLIEEFSLMQKGIRLGQSRREALEEMAKRVDLDALTSVTSAIIQADNLGASLGPVLRVQSEQMRVERFQLAEKLAHQAPVKMLFPLLFLIFPSIVIMLFGPLALKLMSGVFEGIF